MAWWRLLPALALVVAGCLGNPPDLAPVGTDTSSGTSSMAPGPSFDGDDCSHMDSGGTTGGSPSPSPSPRPCACPYREGCPIPAIDTDPDVVFHLNGSYPINGTLALNIRNVGAAAYAYESVLIRRMVDLYTDTGRMVWAGPCYSDVRTYATLEPGDTHDLGARSLRECTQGWWYWSHGSCTASEPLPAGLYHLRHTFCAPAGHTDDCQAAQTRTGADFRIE